MGLLDSLRRARARRILRRAFWIADQSKDKTMMETAIPLLRTAAAIDPSNPHIWNETAFVLGRLGRDSEAMEAALRAVEVAPGEPKFHNAVAGIRFHAIIRAKPSRKEAEPLLKEAVREIEGLIKRWPAYAPFHLGHAEALAASGAFENVWEAALDRAANFYDKQCVMADGLETTGERLRQVLRGSRTQCLNYARWWASLADG
jgi:tetratricopeptide (TPR) repeat protein